MTTTHTKYQVIASTKIDTTEWIIEVERDGKKYVGFVEATGQRVAFDNKPRNYFLFEGIRKFHKLIREGKIKQTENIRFGFWSKGDFVIKENKKGYAEIKGMVSRYAGERLHIEIPKSYTRLFEQGDEVKIIKGDLKALFND